MRVLVADDEKDIAAYLGHLVKSWGHEVVATVTTGGFDTLHLCDVYRPDAVIMDIMMPHFSGLTICHALASRHRGPKVVLISGKLSANHPIIRQSGAVAFLAKPVHREELRRVIDEIAVVSRPVVKAALAN
jgi:CheY-like chemotaxis protein